MTSKQKGFTLTELMLAMAFVSFMLLFLMTAVIHLMRTYNKGVAMRQINQSGRQFAEDFSRTAKYANLGDIKMRKTGPIVDRICLNGVTYAWNLNDPTATAPVPPLTNGYSPPNTAEKFSMVRVTDNGGSLCSNPGINVIDKLSAKEMLPVGLNVKNVSFSTSTTDPRLVSISFVFSTGGYNAPIASATTQTGFACKSGSDGAFCAFADFDVTVYVRN
jgi:prepilin-type N-terminal cleavage/methylation domain-containing protein